MSPLYRENFPYVFKGAQSAARRAKDAAKGLTVTRLAGGAGVVCFAGTTTPPGAGGPARPST